jgi:predicted oxidoreductase
MGWNYGIDIIPIFVLASNHPTTILDMIPTMTTISGPLRLVHGHWRLSEWELTDQELLTLTKKVMELGITAFDHADIYGNHTCEKLFGDALALDPGLRDRLRIVTKCGIKLANPKFPERKIKTYDYSYSHIVSSVEQSLRNFRTDRIDLLLLHRPSPLFDPGEAAKAFSHLKNSGKVLSFGVSNFTPLQFEMLGKYTEEPLVTNQVEISPYCLEHFDNGNMDFFIKEKIKPMAWSPLAGGRLFNPADEKGHRILHVLKEIAVEMQIDALDKIAYAWLLRHPANIIPVVGSGKIERIRIAANAVRIDIGDENWFRIYNAAKGTELP